MVRKRILHILLGQGPLRLLWWLNLLMGLIGTALFAFLVWQGTAQAAPLAITDPDSPPEILSVRAYSGVIESGDLLVVVNYNVEYAVTPVEPISDTYLGRFLRGTTELLSVAPVAFSNNGYGQGVFSLYWSAQERSDDSIEFEDPNGEGYRLVFQGNPSAFASPPEVSTPTITWRPTSETTEELKRDVLALAQQLEADADWRANELDLVVFSGGVAALSTVGATYFVQAIPNLGLMVPGLISSATIVPLFERRTFTNDFTDAFDTFWVTGSNNPMTFATDYLAPSLNVSAATIRGVIGILIVFGVGSLVYIGGKQAGRDSPVEFALAAMAVTFVLLLPVGLMSWAAAGLTAFICTVMVGWTFLGRRAS